MTIEPPAHVRALAAERQSARAARDYARADRLRERLRESGWLVRDAPGGYELVPAPPYELTDPHRLQPRWDEPDGAAASVVMHVTGWPEDAARATTALAGHCASVDYEVVAVVDGAGDPTSRALAELDRADPRLRMFHVEPAVGFGASLNLAMGQATGQVLVWLDPHVEATGDLLTPLLQALAGERVGVAGGWGVVTHSLLDFHADGGPEVDAVEGYLLAVPRALAARVEVDPRHRYYRNADLDYSFAVRDLGERESLRALRVAVPARRHRHRGWHDTDPEERERASKRNYDRFLARWKSRTDLCTRGFTGYHRHDR